MNNSNPRDWVLVKSWSNTPLTPKFEDPLQVLLTTHNTVQTQEKGRTHIASVRGPVQPLDTRLNSPVSSAEPAIRTPFIDPQEWVVTQGSGDSKITQEEAKS